MRWCWGLAVWFVWIAIFSVANVHSVRECLFRHLLTLMVMQCHVVDVQQAPCTLGLLLGCLQPGAATVMRLDSLAGQGCLAPWGLGPPDLAEPQSAQSAAQQPCELCCPE